MPQVEIKKIDRHPGTQARVKLNEDTVAHYRQLLKDGEVLPPIELMNVDGKLYLVDGFHRTQAYIYNRISQIDANIKDGALKEVFIEGIKANSKHGLNYNKEDRKKIYKQLKEDESYKILSNIEIGKMLGCSEGTIRNIENELISTSQITKTETIKTVTKTDGTTKTMNTTNIGKKKIEPIVVEPIVAQPIINNIISQEDAIEKVLQDKEVKRIMKIFETTINKKLFNNFLYSYSRPSGNVDLIKEAIAMYIDKYLSSKVTK